MSLSVIFLVICIFAVSQGATTIGDSKNGHRQSDIQVTRPTVSESSSVRSIQDEMRNAHLKLQANQIEGSGIRDDKQSHQGQILFHSQDLHATGTPLDRDMGRDQASFQSQRNNALQTTTISTVPSESSQLSELSFRQLNQDLQRNTPDNQQLFTSNLQSRNQQQFYNDKQQASDEQQFYNSRQQQSPVQQQLFPARQQTPSQQQFYNFRQNAPSQQDQIYNPREQSSVQDQQQIFNTRQQVHEQQKIYSNMQAMDINDQRINLNHQFQGVSVHQSQIRSDRPRILSQDLLTQIQTKGIRKDVQLSAYDNREHGLTLPRSSSVGPVVVSGLKNLPLLPAMVYNGGVVPSSHAIAYGRDGYYKGSASLRQQLQTPYVRYVYSHIL